MLVFKKGLRFRTKRMEFIYTPNELAISRLGLVVSKKSVGKAFARNRVKRVLRDIFRQDRSLLEPDIDLIIRASQSFLPFTFQEVRAEFSQFLKRVNEGMPQ